jgi:predicted RNA binding protein YcfA (HicA-like mRNA interferase family)
MSKFLLTVKLKEAIKALQKAGFYIHHQTGSHIVMKHPANHRVRPVIPIHNKDLKKGTLRSIVNQASLSIEEFIKLF